MRQNGQMHVDPLVQETTEESRGTWAAKSEFTQHYGILDAVELAVSWSRASDHRLSRV